MNKEILQTLVVDDHHLFRSGIVALLSNTPSIKIIGEASDGLDALAILSSKKADLVILDIQMSGMDGLSACKEIKKIDPNIAVLILSWHCDQAQLSQLLESGAKGFLVKDCTKEELQTAIQAVSQGGSYFSNPITDMVLSLKSKKSHNVFQEETKTNLTEREQEVLECIANEYTNKEIAGRLYISQRTVETHRRNLIQKLQVKNTVGLVKYYFNTFPVQQHYLRINT